MNEQMKTDYYTGFTNGDYYIRPFHVFSVGERCMMIQKDNGVTIFADRDFVDTVISGDLDEKSKYFLISRGFAGFTNTPSPRDPSACIMPTFFLIDMTNGCNLACSYCLRVPEHMGRSISSERVDAICKYILEHCRQHRLQRISIQPWGGEPLLMLDRIVQIREYFDKYPELQVCITVETNGTLLTPETLKILSDHHVIVSISTDGPASIQDHQRRDRKGNGTSERVREACRAIAAEGHYDLGGICVLTDHSLGHIAQILEYSGKVLHMKSLKMNIMHQPAYPCVGVRALNTDEVVEAAEEIVSCVLQMKREGSKFREINSMERIRNLTARKQGNICHSCGCCGGKRMVSFDMEGNIYPCELTDWPDECLGNIDDGEDLCVLVERAISQDRPYFRARKKEDCEECPWWYYCRGGCSSQMKYMHREGADGVDETECAFNRSMYPLLVRALLTEPELFGEGD